MHIVKRIWGFILIVPEERHEARTDGSVVSANPGRFSEAARPHNCLSSCGAANCCQGALEEADAGLRSRCGTGGITRAEVYGKRNYICGTTEGCPDRIPTMRRTSGNPAEWLMRTIFDWFNDLRAKWHFSGEVVGDKERAISAVLNPGPAAQRDIDHLAFKYRDFRP